MAELVNPRLSVIKNAPPVKTTLANLSSAQSAGYGERRVIDAIKLAISTPAGWHTLPSITPYPRTRQGIVNAIAAIKSVGNGTGIIQYEDAVYDVSDYSAGAIKLHSGIHHIGVMPTFDFTGSTVPDQTFKIKAGTILDGGNAGYSAFELNNVDLDSATSAAAESGASFARAAGYFASNGQSGFGLHGIGFRKCKRAVDTGAKNNVGALYAYFEWLVAEDCTDVFPFNFINFQHCKFEHIYQKTALSYGGGIQFAANVPTATLLPGNSTADEIYTFCTDHRCCGITVRAYDGAQLNQFKTGRVQSNRYGSATAKTASVAVTNGAIDIAISPADMGLIKAGMVVSFESTYPNWLAAGDPYFISSVNTVNNTFTISDFGLGGGANTLASTGTYTMTIGGFPAVELAGYYGTGLLTACIFQDFDIEAVGHTASLAIQRTRYCNIHVSEQMAGTVGKSTSIIDASGTLTYSYLSSKTFKCDTSSTMRPKQTYVSQVPLTITANSALTATGASIDAKIVNPTAFTYAVTIPKSMPRGFGMKLAQAGAGKCNFIAGSGVTITSAGGGLYTNGSNTEIELVETARNVYIVIGNSAAS